MIETADTVLRRLQNTLTGSHPAVDETVSWLTRSYVFSWIRLRSLHNSLQHDAPIDPARVVWVDPDRIQRTVSWTELSTRRKADELPRFRPPKYRLAGQVFGGEWDRTDRQFADSTIYQSFVRHFTEAVPWAETAFYTDACAAIEQGATLWGCSTVEAFDRRCSQLDALYEEIRTNGYHSQTELYRRGDSSARSHQLYRTVWDEIAVAVGRDGSLLFVDGRNRLAIAKILGVESVPVVLLVRHSRWQQLRNRIARRERRLSELPPPLQSHPDLSSL